MNDYSGMTVNERLFKSDQMNKFDEAICSMNKQAAIAILVGLEIPEQDANEAVSLIFANPAKYGFKST